MSDAASQVKEEPNYLGMSDEEMLEVEAPEVKGTEAEADESSDDADEDQEESTEEETSEEAGEPADRQGEASPEEGDDEEEKEESKEEKEESLKKDEEEEKEEEKPSESAVDYEAEYKRLLTPFKANGREIAVKSIDDAISLMQMGANYNKKMAALKPNLKLMKLLENNGLLSEEKLGFLIDLDKKDPKAIGKLVKESGIDPVDLSTEGESEYKPKIHTVDDREIDLDTVLDEIQDTPTYNRTLSIVSKEWDGASKQVIANQPQLLKVINSHVDTGIYDLIMKEVESERVFGRLNGLSDIEAYRQVGDAIEARGGFNHLTNPEKKPESKPVVVTPKPKKVEDDKLKEKRRAASSTKPAAPSSAVKEFNPLAMSDEEFAKIADNEYR